MIVSMPQNGMMGGISSPTTMGNTGPTSTMGTAGFQGSSNDCKHASKWNDGRHIISYHDGKYGTYEHNGHGWARLLQFWHGWVPRQLQYGSNFASIPLCLLHVWVLSSRLRASRTRPTTSSLPPISWFPSTTSSPATFLPTSTCLAPQPTTWLLSASTSLLLPAPYDASISSTN